MATAEWSLKEGFVDYALFVGLEFVDMRIENTLSLKLNSFIDIFDKKMK
jgi:hypothetical protein